MNTVLVTIDRAAADPVAERYFNAICGFDRGPGDSGGRQRALQKEGHAVLERLNGQILLRAIVSSHDRFELDGRRLSVGGEVFECPAFEQIGRGHARKVYAYILTAGNYDLGEASTSERFFADTWGTAYVDAARDLLREHVLAAWRESAGSGAISAGLSDSFGPGFYGMEHGRIRSLFRLVPGTAIGVSLSWSLCMIPVKSCAGLYIAVDEPGILPPDACRTCIGAEKGCAFCSRMSRRKGTDNGEDR